MTTDSTTTYDTVDALIDSTVDLDTTVNERTRPFRSLVEGPEGWELAPIGQLVAQRYRNPRNTADTSLLNVQFRSTTKDKDYELGVFKDSEIVDHAAIFEPILAAGWTVAKHDVLRSGAKALTTFKSDDFPVEDIIRWDGLYQDDRPLLPSLLVRADARRGSSYSITAGWFRLVCTNGLVSKQFELGHVEFQHGTKDLATKVREFMNTVASGERFRLETGRTFDVRAVPVIRDRFLLDAEAPAFIKEAVHQAIREVTVKELPSLHHQLELIEGNNTTGTVSILDILNIFTNASRNFRSGYTLESALKGWTTLFEVAEYMAK